MPFRSEPPRGGPETLARPDSQQLVEFYLAFGQAVASWQIIESYIYFIFLNILKFEGGDAALSAAFHSPPGFRVRLDMVDAAAKQNLDGVNLKDWSLLRDDLVKAAKKRNKLAHGIVGFCDELPKEKQIFIINNPSNSSTWQWPPSQKNVSYLPDIQSTLNLFSSLGTRVGVFAVQIKPTKGGLNWIKRTESEPASN